jgi:signal transduction histidine kinase/ligand-binding sensor domain-containing protein
MLMTATLAVLALDVRVAALDPDRALTQYLHDQWGSGRGFPGGPVHAITQGEDGYLWIAAERGLVRFDGLSFQLFEPSGLTAGSGPTVLGVAADPDGSLWARLRGPALVRYRQRKFEDVLAQVGQSVVTAMIRAQDGAILLTTLGQGALAYRHGRFEPIAAAAQMPHSFAISIAETSDGVVWLGTRDAGLLRVQGATVTRIMEGLPDPKINCLLAGTDGDLWIGTDQGVSRWHDGEVTQIGVPPEIRKLPALAMMRDRESNMWIAAGGRGLLRVNEQGVSARVTGAGALPTNVTAIFEDRDGNLWVGTTDGLERMRDGVFTSYASAQGLPSDSAGPIFVDDGGRTWFAPTTGGLYWLRDGRVVPVTRGGLADDVVYSIGGGGGDVWVGRQRGGLTRLRFDDGDLSVERYTQAGGLAQDSVYAVHRARDGAVWAGTLSGGASRFKDGSFTNYDTTNGLASNTVASILEGGDGTIWFGTPNGVSTFSRGGWRRYAVDAGLPSNDVNVLMEDTRGLVWVGTAAGLAVFDGGRVQTPANTPALLRQSILGLAEDRTGSIWVTTAERVLRVNRDGLLHGILGDGDLREYGVSDGLLAIEGVKRHRSVVTDPRGRVWLSMMRGLSVVDPGRVDGKTMPALTQIEDVSADGTSIDLFGDRSIPSGQRRITLSYAGLSLGVPERVMFRYRLDGFDRDWSRPVAERQAVYTNLNPGSYVFRVRASNSDGLWTGAEAMVNFAVKPTLWQTTWFRLSIVALAGLAGWGAYRLRMMRVAHQLNLRFEERLAERTRIAQDLHDTLLQGFMSASMQLHVAAEAVPVDSPAKSLLAHVLQLMRRVTDDGRNAVRGLRSSAVPTEDLEQAFTRIPTELPAQDQIPFRVIVEGQPRPMHPLIRDEIYRIGREAIVNAFRHSGASLVEMELEYSTRHVRMLVRDDGKGIDEQVLRTGRDGHWGLSGMRERAQRIGAGFQVWSRGGAGTEVELSVPNHVAFQAPASHTRHS